MRPCRRLLFFTFFLISAVARSQDTNLEGFQLTPVHTNPALAGSAGALRIIAADSYAPVASGNANAGYLSADLRNNGKFMKGGFSFQSSVYSDPVGDVTRRASQFSFGYAPSWKLKEKSRLALGLNLGLFQGRTKYERRILTGPSGLDVSYGPSLDAGISYISRSLNFGISTHCLLTGDNPYRFWPHTTNKLYLSYAINGGDSSKKWIFCPSLYLINYNYYSGSNDNGLFLNFSAMYKTSIISSLGVSFWGGGYRRLLVRGGYNFGKLLVSYQFRTYQTISNAWFMHEIVLSYTFKTKDRNFICPVMF
jgi:hypothetical protein